MSLPGPDVVLYATFPFSAEVPLGDWQIARALARLGCRVIFVDPPLTQMSVLRGSRPAEMQLEEVEPNLRVLRPWPPAGPSASVLGTLSNVLVDIQVRRVLGRLGWWSHMLLTMAPERGPLNLLPRGQLVYWQKDRQYAAPGLRHSPRLRSVHERLLLSSDVVTGVSAALVEDGRRLGVRVELVPNGWDPGAHTQSPISRAVAEKVSDLPHPRVVLLGHLTDRVDLDLLRAIVAARPNWSFILVGHSSSERPEGLHEVGTLPPREVASVLVHCDVGVVPYVRSEFNEAANPLKVFDYLGAGIPVITSNVDVGDLVRGDGAVMSVFGGSNEWLSCLDDVVRDLPRYKQAASSTASTATWDERARRLLRIVTGAPKAKARASAPATQNPEQET